MNGDLRTVSLCGIAMLVADVRGAVTWVPCPEGWHSGQLIIFHVENVMENVMENVTLSNHFKYNLRAIFHGQTVDIF